MGDIVSRGQTLFRAGAIIAFNISAHAGALILKAMMPLRGMGSGHAKLGDIPIIIVYCDIKVS